MSVYINVTNSMKKRNKKYLLFVYGEWINDSYPTSVLKDLLSPIVENSFLKIVSGPSSAIASFKSAESFEDIDEFIREHMPKQILNYFFIVKPRKMGYRLPGGLDEHLFNLDKDTKERNEEYLPPIVSDIQEIDFSIGNDITFEDEISRLNDIVDDFIKDIRKIRNGNELDLDEILDKISEKGLTSLTVEEKEFLDKHNQKN